MEKTIKSIVLFLLLFMCVGLTAQNSITGVIIDEASGEALIGANVIIAGTAEGTITDIDGSFDLSTSRDLPLDLEISYTGYGTQTISATTSDIGSISLAEGLLLTDEVVVSASRRREKVQEAPASITVINARKLAASPQTNAARNLISAPGVTIQQQSAERINIQLRGDGGLFGSASFPILDYRSLSGPGLGTYDALNSPVNNIDVERIEVVRGPGSALYGPGVTSGVVHFISKSAIDNPGTTLELTGGQLNTFGISARHATKVSDKFGFKINVNYKKGGEFLLDASDPRDAEQIAKFNTTIVKPGITNGTVDPTAPTTTLLTTADLDPDGDGNMMQDFWQSDLITGTLEFRPQDDLSLVVSGGTNAASAVFYNSQGEGLAQSREFWTQARLQKGGLFAQAFWLTNDGGKDDKPTFLYQTGAQTRIQRTQLEAQLQYNFDIESFLNSNWTAGFDYRQSAANSFNTVYGRNEGDDDYGIYGAYVQGKFGLGDKLDLVVAGRVDQFSFLDETAFQPRAVLVYKANNKNTFRFGFNRAVGAPTQLQVNIDFPVNVPVPGAFDIWLAGNKEGHTFNNPQIVFNGATPFPSLPIGTPGFPNAYTYGAVAGPVLEQLIPGIAAATGSPELAGAIQGFLTDPANTPGGMTGQFVGINLFNGQPLGLTDAPVASLRTEDTWEFGYKGLIGDKLSVLVDVYNKTIDGATLFTAISPGYTLAGANFGGDLGSAVAGTGIEQFIFGALGGDLNPAAGPTAAALTETIVGSFAAGGDGFAAGVAPLIDGAILATTPTDRTPNDGVTHLAAGYRTFDSFGYTGVDAGLEYYVSQDFSLYGNYSYISDNVFNPVIKGSDGATERTSNSAPLNKFRLGFNFTPASGLRGNLSFQHDDSYEVFIGQDFSGDTEVRNIFDGAIGYKFDNGLAIDLTGQNLMGTKYRYFPGFPKLGRRMLAKLTYTFGAE